MDQACQNDESRDLCTALPVLCVGGCQHYGLFVSPSYNTAPSIWGTQERTTILTATQVNTGLCSREAAKTVEVNGRQLEEALSCLKPT